MSRSLNRAISILNLFNNQKETWGITEISRELDLPKSTVHGLVKTFESHHYLEMTEGGKYRLGIRVYELGMTYQTSARLETVSEPQIRQLINKYRQSVHVAIYAGRMAVFVIANKAGSSNIIVPRIGAGIAAYCTGVGKAMLAWQSPSHIDEYLQSEPLTPYTAHTITSPEILREELQKIRDNGYAVDQEEALLGVGCVAAPIFGSSGQVIAAISISGTPETINSRLAECIEDVKLAGRAIGIGMGYRS